MNKRVLVAICGGIAAYKSAELVRLLIKAVCDVRVVMTKSATKFITPLTFQALSGFPVQTQILDVDEENAMGHINLARWADLIIVAPATANMCAKLAQGLADDLVSTLCLATEAPIYIAPAMNHVMWDKTVTQDNIKRLQDYGFKIIHPEQGEQACGETGFGRMAEPETICQQLLKNKPSELEKTLPDLSAKEQPLQGIKILISAGATREPLDPVRYITNRSSGKMGYALAQAAINQGATVSLISGVVNLTPPTQAKVIYTETAAQMYTAILDIAETQDIYIGAAAVADYAPIDVKNYKIKKQAQENILILEKTKDILAAVACLNKRPFVVGFAAETDDLAVYARGKLVRKKLDMIAANWVGKTQGGFENDENALEVFWHNGQHSLPMQDKQQLAKALLALIIERWNEKNTVKNTG